jgi:glutamine synthetase
MTSRAVLTLDDVRAYVREHDVSHVMLAITDLDGILRGKHLAAGKFLSAAERGGAFCEVVLGWDSDDAVYETTARTGVQTGFPDQPIVIDVASGRPLPGDRPSLVFLADFAEPLSALCPRNVLKRVIERAAASGFTARAALEYEFFLFDETPQSVRDKGYRDLRPITPGGFGYSVLRSAVWRDLYDDILSTCDGLGVPVEGLHEESGAGVLEAAIAVDDALEAADRGVLFKTFVKALAQRRGLMATFMSRWSLDWPGQGGHIHLSLQDRAGAPVFHDEHAAGSMSPTMRHFIGGQQALLPDLLAMTAPTINSYTRLVPGYWAPTTATWGIENRTCALRVVPGAPSAQRVEYRIAGADANPYLALAAALGSGLHGVEHQLEPSAPVEGNAYERTDADPLPATLWDAAQRLRNSSAAAELFGDDFVDHFAASREWEEREFRRNVTSWELERYFEAI